MAMEQGLHFNDLSIDKAKIVLGAALKSRTPVFITGSPGIGKSEMCYQIANEDDRKLTEARLILMEPIDLRGLPSVKDTYRIVTEDPITRKDMIFGHCRLISDSSGRMNFIAPRYNEEGDVEGRQILQLNPDNIINIEVEGLSKWNKPDWFPIEDGKKHLLLLDEINGAPPSVQAAAYELVWNNRIGEHNLPENSVVWAAGNRAQDRAVTHQVPSPLRSRWMTINLQVDPDVWKKWAWANDVDDRIVGFIAFQNDALTIHHEDELQKQSYPSPRSWVMLSNLIKNNSNMEKEILAAITAGTVGEGVATNFLTFMDTHSRIPDVDDILSGKIEYDFPGDESPAYKWALCCSIASRGRKRKGETPADLKKRIMNIYKFALSIPDDHAEFGALIGIETFSFNPQVVQYIADKTADSPFRAWNSKYVDLFKQS